MQYSHIPYLRVERNPKQYSLQHRIAQYNLHIISFCFSFVFFCYFCLGLISLYDKFEDTGINDRVSAADSAFFDLNLNVSVRDGKTS